MKRVKVIYRKNLKMNEGKIASQVAHAVLGLVEDSLKKLSSKPDIIVVLGVSDKKFFELTAMNECFTQFDWGLTEIEKGTHTASAWFEY